VSVFVHAKCPGARNVREVRLFVNTIDQKGLMANETVFEVVPECIVAAD
jgi:hypothetical protein